MNSECTASRGQYGSSEKVALHSARLCLARAHTDIWTAPTSMNSAPAIVCVAMLKPSHASTSKLTKRQHLILPIGDDLSSPCARLRWEGARGISTLGARARVCARMRARMRGAHACSGGMGGRTCSSGRTRARTEGPEGSRARGFLPAALSMITHAWRIVRYTIKMMTRATTLTKTHG